MLGGPQTHQLLLDFGHQGRSRRCKGVSALDQDGQRRLTFAAFQFAVIRPIHTGQKGKSVLRNLAFKSPRAKNRATRACHDWIEGI